MKPALDSPRVVPPVLATAMYRAQARQLRRCLWVSTGFNAAMVLLGLWVWWTR